MMTPCHVAISCHLLSNKFQFPGTWLRQGDNSFVVRHPCRPNIPLRSLIVPHLSSIYPTLLQWYVRHRVHSKAS